MRSRFCWPLAQMRVVASADDPECPASGRPPGDDEGLDDPQAVAPVINASQTMRFIPILRLRLVEPLRQPPRATCQATRVPSFKQHVS